MKTIKNNLIAVFFLTTGLLWLNSTAAAAVLAEYPFTSSSWSSVITEPHTVASSVSSGNSSGVLLSGAGNLYYQFATQHNKSEAIASDYYAAFTLTPDAGYMVSYSALSFDYGGSWGNSVGTPSYQANFFVRSSLDGFSADLVEFSYTVPGMPEAMTPESITVDLSQLSVFQSVNEAVTFRIYAFTDRFEGQSFSVTARPRLDNIVLEGTVGVIPEPSTTVLLLASALAGFVLLTQRRR